jgi:hypothetical protein
MPARKGLPYFEGRSPKCSSMTMQAYHLKATPPLNYWRPWGQAFFPSSNVQKLMNKSSREVISNTYILTNIIFKKVL